MVSKSTREEKTESFESSSRTWENLGTLEKKPKFVFAATGKNKRNSKALISSKISMSALHQLYQVCSFRWCLCAHVNISKSIGLCILDFCLMFENCLGFSSQLFLSTFDFLLFQLLLCCPRIIYIVISRNSINNKPKEVDLPEQVFQRIENNNNNNNNIIFLWKTNLLTDELLRKENYNEEFLWLLGRRKENWRHAKHWEY